MSGRGAKIVVRRIDTGEELFLSCALHAPLYILKQQLQTITQEPPENQVIVLRHPEDDNQDVLLEGDDNWQTLRQCGISQGSVLTLDFLHAIGSRAAPSDGNSVPTFRAPSGVGGAVHHELTTEVGPKDADHCYNGIIFDVRAKEPYEVVVTSVQVGGMLGHVRIFTRSEPWAGEGIESCSVPSFWGRRYEVNPSNWDLVADVECSPSWDKPFEIMLDPPLILLPGQQKGIYVHSNLPNDLGIQYQTYRRNTPFAEDQHIELHPGVGHTSNLPFDRENGWYRGLRELAGTLGYSCQVKRWSPDTHHQFSKTHKECVQAALTCHASESCALSILPQDLVLQALQFCHWNWFDLPPPLLGSGQSGEEQEEGSGMEEEDRGRITRSSLHSHFTWPTTDSDSDSDSDSEIQTETQTLIQIQTQEGDSDSDSDSEIQTETRTLIQTQTQRDSMSDSDSDSDSETQTETQTSP